MKNAFLPGLLIRGFVLTLLLPGVVLPQAESNRRMELRRPVRNWEFVDAVGRKASLLGNENGHLEAWIYPLKLFRDFTLRFHLEDKAVPAEDLAREVIVRPESTTIVYATASWTVRQTLFVPPEEPGALIRFDIDAFEPLQIEAQFVRDFQLMWPAALGGTFIEWDKKLGVFILGHEEKKYAGVIGSPSMQAHRLEFLSNSGGSDMNSLLLNPVAKGHTTQFIYISGSIHGRAEAEKQYQTLMANSQHLEAVAAQYYKDFLQRTVSLELPDPSLQSAYDWSRISMLQGMVDSPLLGLGLIAGYRTSAYTQRPGFAWYFGRDSLWTDFALDSIGDFSSARSALEFILRYQREDGKVEHEVSQTATLVPWFKDFVYAYNSADATPLLILAANDYVTASGDMAFLNRYWDNLWRTYQFLKSTYNSNGLPRNKGVGHGWIEGGPLFPVESEVYQSGLGTAALAAMAHLAHLAGKPEVERQLNGEYEEHRKITNETFWSKPQNSLIFAVNEKKEPVDVPTVLSTAPFWFEVFDSEKAAGTIDRLASAEHATDWGMRVLSDRNPLFDPSGYHFGSVWPLFTGWASLGEYVYHRPLQAYANLRANANLVFDGSLGHATEVLSGSYREPLSTSSPHQIWSSAMVVSPLVRGLLGITSSAVQNEITVAPHTPAGWNSWSAKNVPACGGTADLTYRKTSSKESLEVLWHKSGSSSEHNCTVTFSPAVSLHAKIGKAIKVKVDETSTDQHPTVSTVIANDSALLQIPVEHDFQLAIPADLPPLGERSGNLKLIHESWSADRTHLRLELQGISGKTYQIQSFGAAVASADGAQLVKVTSDEQQINITFAADAPDADGYTSRTVTLNFAVR
jgi:glycogen debranching enzyme